MRDQFQSTYRGRGHIHNGFHGTKRLAQPTPSDLQGTPYHYWGTICDRRLPRSIGRRTSHCSRPTSQPPGRTPSSDDVTLHPGRFTQGEHPLTRLQPAATFRNSGRTLANDESTSCHNA